jgi:diguanylate cyclase (GGDEF)-like protein/PAS domain S-box-containing protein
MDAKWALVTKPKGTAGDSPDDRLHTLLAEHLRTAFEEGTTGMVVWTRDGSVVRVNQAFCALVGRSRAELREMSVGAVVHPDDRDVIRKLIRAAIDEGAPGVLLDVRLLGPDETVIETQAAVSIARDDAGEVLYLFAQVHDVTELCRAQQVLAANEHRHRSMIDTAGDAYIAIDGAGVVQAWNPAAERMFGWDRGEIIGRELAEHLIPPELREMHRAGLRRYARDQVARVLGETLELTALRRDGSRFPIELTVWASETEGLAAFHAFVRDISDRERLHQQMLRHSRVFATITDAVVVTDAEGRVVDANAAAEELFGLSSADMLGHLVGANEDPLAAARRWSEVRDGLQEHGRWTGDVSYLRGGLRRVRETTVVPIHDGVGAFVGAVLVSNDVTEKRRLAAELAQSERRWRLTIDHAPIGIALSRLDGGWLRVNAAFCRIVGYSEEVLLRGTFQDLSHPDDLPAELALRGQLLTGALDDYTLEQRFIHARGHDVWVRLWVSLVWDQHGEPLHYITQVEDIGESRAHTERLAELALQDALTGLANRTVFLDRLTAVAAGQRETGHRFGVVYIDVDDFKHINDTHGHSTGDELLVACARRLISALRPGDTTARLGGDEFAVLLTPLAGPSEAEEIARRLLADLTRPYRIGDGRIETSVSIGVALHHPDDPGSATLALADDAMYRAKQAGKGRYVISA